MNRRLFGLAMFLLLAIGCASNSGEPSATNEPTSNPAPEPSAKEATFAEVSSLLGSKCLPCHGEGGKAGLDLRTHESIMKGASKGPVVLAGKPDESIMVHSLRGTNGIKQMPMSAVPLSDPEVEMIKSWIAAGAKGS
ncbi:MAG TPA: hypothetical protein PKA27_00275 [Fimbriimonadaceae bacterium]|nr:hypothetical protein [Fimbriimonadaceae bacterium]